jgi:arylsulfatase A-like enzyme
MGDWKFIPGGKGERKNKNTGTELGNEAAGQLFDLSKDPGETKNLAKEHPEKVEELKKKLDEVRG